IQRNRDSLLSQRIHLDLAARVTAPIKLPTRQTARDTQRNRVAPSASEINPATGPHNPTEHQLPVEHTDRGISNDLGLQKRIAHDSPITRACAGFETLAQQDQSGWPQQRDRPLLAPPGSQKPRPSESNRPAA